MTRAFLIAAAGVALVQLIPQSPDEIRFYGYYVASRAALLLFLSGMAFAARGLRFASWAEVLPAVGGSALVVFAAPRVCLPPTAELVEFLLGGLSRGVVALWLALRHWWQSRLAAILVGVGGILGALEFRRAGLSRYAQYFETLSRGIAGIIAWGLSSPPCLGLPVYSPSSGARLRGALERSTESRARSRPPNDEMQRTRPAQATKPRR